MLLGHGSDIHLYNHKVEADFSSNVWHGGMPNGLEEHLQNSLNKAVHYPSPDAYELSLKIVDLHQLSANNVLPTNGATEAFYLIAQLYTASKSYILYPSFSEYEDACRAFKHDINYIPNKEFQTEHSFKESSLVWIGNPNNPDGKIISVGFIEVCCISHPEVFFIIDEAYADLFDGFESVIHLVEKYSNLIVVRSLTKAFAIPGIRLGYIVASTKIIKEVKNLKMPWSVNSMAIEAGKFILSNYNSIVPNKKEIIEASIKLQSQLSEIPDLCVYPSSGNYFLVNLKKGRASDLKQYLVDQFGLLIRDASNFKGLNESYFRVSLQDSKNNLRLVKGINQWLRNN